MLCLDIGRVSGQFGHLPEYRGITGTPPGVNGPTWAMREKRRAGQGRPRAPSPSSPNWTRRGGGAPLSFLSSLPSFPLSYLDKEKEGVLLPVGVGLLPGAPPPGWPPLPLDPLYTGAGGTSRDNN